MFGSVVEEETTATSQLTGLLDQLHNLELSALSNENLLTLTRDLETL